MTVTYEMNKEQIYMEVNSVVRNLQLVTKLAFPRQKLVWIESICVSENHLFCHRVYTFNWLGTVKAWSEGPRALWAPSRAPFPAGGIPRPFTCKSPYRM